MCEFKETAIIKKLKKSKSNDNLRRINIRYINDKIKKKLFNTCLKQKCPPFPHQSTLMIPDLIISSTVSTIISKNSSIGQLAKELGSSTNEEKRQILVVFKDSQVHGRSDAPRRNNEEEEEDELRRKKRIP